MNSSSYIPFPGRFCNDPLWDWNVTWTTDDPDLTQCLQWTVLVWIPCLFFWITVIFKLHTAGRNPHQNQQWTTLSAMKTVLAGLLVVHAAVQIGYYLSTRNVPHAELTAAFVRLATFSLATVVTIREKRRAKAASATLFLFWLFLLTSATLTLYSALRQKEFNEFRCYMEMVYFPTVLLQFILSCWADKYPETRAHSSKVCPEEHASFPSRMTFWWMTRLVFIGWRRPLTKDDLWDLPAEDATAIHARRFEMYWATEMKRREETRDEYSPSLTKTLWRTFWMTLSISALLRLTGDLFIFLAPYQLKLLIRFVNDKNQESWKGYVYVVGMLLGSSAQVLALAHYFLYNQRTGMHIRSAVVTAVYRKALRMTSAAARASTIGEMVNLMSVDSQRLMDFMNHIQLLWSSPLQIVLAMFFLWQEMGLATLSGVAALALLIPFNAWVAGRSKGYQVAQMKSKDSRIKLMNEILNGMKILKLYAWEPSFEQQVLDIREKELSTLKKAAHLTALSSFIMQSSSFVVALVTFATFVSIDEANVLDAEKAFVSLTLFNILRRPLTLLPDAINSLVQARVSVKRVRNFLLNRELDLTSIQRLPAGDPLAVQASDGSFSWDDGPQAKVILHNLDVSVASGSLVAVVGPVGSGKSSLLAAMLGLMPKLSGQLALQEKVAYVTQQAWIQNLSLRDNILFGKPWDEGKYQRVLQACALTADLAMLPAGDQTEIGEKGINLSGGQKQRVSLARAVYSEAEVYFLDDPLSALDAHVGKHIFEQVIGPHGLLAKRTRLLVTHAMTFLPQTDSIIVVAEGHIAECGSYQALISNNGHFAEFLETFQSEGHHVENTTVGQDNNVQEPSAHEAAGKLSVGKVVTVDKGVSEGEGKSLEAAEAKKGRLVQAETSQSGSVSWKVYIMFLRNMRWVVTGGIFVWLLLANAANVATNVWLGEWASDARIADRSNSSWWRNYRLGVYGGLGSAQSLFILASALCLAAGQIHASRQQHQAILARLMRAPMAFFDTTPLGRIINRFSKDIDTLDVQIPQNFRLWINSLFQVAATLVIVCMATPLFLTIVVPLGLMYYMVQRFYIPSSRQLKRLESTSRSPIYSHFQESMAGASIIVAQQLMEPFMLQNERLLDYNNGVYLINGHAQRWLSMRVEFVGIFAVFFAALFAVVGRDKEWGMEDKNVGLSISYALNVTQILNLMVRVTSELETNIVSVERIQEYTEIDQEAPWMVESSRPQDSWPAEGRLTFNNYTTRYREGLPLVLRGVTADIKGGEKVGIVGRTGAGKSSLTLALFRLIEGTSGSLSIDDVDIRTLGLHHLRSRLTIIPQEPVLFSGSLRMNLDPFGAYCDEEIWKALGDAHLGQYAMSLDGGLHHAIAEGGKNLSVGQRQLICLARALLRKSKIVVLDEATAAIDLESDAVIQTSIRQQFADCTVLTIAHRLSTVMDSTRVMVVDQGVITEFAPPALLLHDHSSMFYALARSANLAP